MPAAERVDRRPSGRILRVGGHRGADDPTTDASGGGDPSTDAGAEKPAPPPVFAQSDLGAAFAEGLAQGRQEAEAQRLGQICGALAALSERLAAESAARAASAEDQLRAIAPLIGALLDGIIPAVARGRLEAALLAELRQLAASVTPLAATIRCGPDMAAFVSACLAATGI